jgi:L-rhamnose-H+ transport protein
MNPALGVLLHAIAAFAGASFYLPFKKVRNWSWESYWIVNGLFAWIIMPLLIALVTVPLLGTILSDAPAESVFWTFFFGLCWGVGGLTFGLSLRYLGISLGMALVLGITTAFGTLVPPIFAGQFGELVTSTSGLVTLAGVIICLIGIFFAGWAGVSKENELSAEEKQKFIKEFNFKKGLVVAVISGIMSACFAFGVQSGKPIADLAMQHGTPALWQNSTVMLIIMFGGFITNAFYCGYMNIRNRSFRDYVNFKGAPLGINFLFSAIAGITASQQFMFYGLGTTKMGEYDWASFSILLALVIVFSTMWGLITKEWKGSSRRTMGLIFLGITVLVLSTVAMAYGSALAAPG